MLLSLFFFTIGVRQLLLSSVFPPAPVPLSFLPVGVPVCNSRHWITASIGLPAVVGAGDLFPSPKYVVRSFFKADLGFLGRTCLRSLCWFPLVGSAYLIGVAVILSLLRAPFPSSMIEIFGLIRFLISINFLSVRMNNATSWF